MHTISTIFFGSSIYSVIILEKLLTLSNFKVVAVVTKPDKATGRSRQITSNPVASFAMSRNLPLLQPTNFDQAFVNTYQDLHPELALCVAFGPPFFNQNMIDIPKFKIVNIHPSPLPKYRGATPGPWQIINGQSVSSVCFFQIDALPDHGPIIAQVPFDIDHAWTSHDFYQHAFNLAAQNLEKILQSYINNPQALTPQDHNLKSYYPKFTKDTAKIDWTWPVDKIERFIRAMLPWPVAWTLTKNNQGQTLTMKIFSSQLSNGQFQPLSVQIEGKTKTDWHQIDKYYQIIKS